MSKVTVNETLNADAAAVWAQLGNFSGLQAGGAIEKVEYVGEGVGMTRSIHLANGVVVERLLEHDPDAREFTYAIINDDSPLPFADYSATVRLQENADGSTTVDWTGRFEPAGVDEATAEKIASGIYRNAIQGARAALEA